MSRSNQLILSGLLYTKLALVYHILFSGEATLKFVFNVTLGIIIIAVGLVAKGLDLRRSSQTS